MASTHPRMQLRQEAVELVSLHAPPLSVHKAGQRMLLTQRSRAWGQGEEAAAGLRGRPPAAAAEPPACSAGWPVQLLLFCNPHMHSRAYKLHHAARTWSAQARQAAREARQRVCRPATAGGGSGRLLQAHRRRHVASGGVASRRGGSQRRIEALFRRVGHAWGA